MSFFFFFSFFFHYACSLLIICCVFTKYCISLFLNYMLRSSRINWKWGALIVRYSEKKECISFLFSCFKNLSIVITLGTTGLIQVFSKMYFYQSGFQSNRNWKCHKFNFRLIPLDGITFIHTFFKLLFIIYKHLCIDMFRVLLYIGTC